MSEILTQFMALGPWSWMIFAVLLLVVEILLPGTFMLWFGVAALITGLIALAIPMTWQGQVIVFIIVSIVSIFIGRKFWNPKDQTSDQPHLNKRAKKHIGQTYAVAEPIENGRGKVRIGDSYWVVTGPDCAAGSQVRVTGTDGNHLLVELAEGASG